MNTFLRLLAVVAVSCSTAFPALAAAPVVPVGGVNITLPEPAGLNTLLNKNSAFFKGVTKMQAEGPGNRVLVIYLLPDQAIVADANDLPDSDEWALATLLKSVGEKPISNSSFVRELLPVVADSIEKAVSKSDFRKKIETANNDTFGEMLKERGGPKGASLTLDSVQPLGVYAKESRYFVYGMVTKNTMTVNGVEEKIPMVSMVVLVSVRDRLVGLAYHRTLKARADIDAAKAKAIAWAQAIVKANP